MSKEIEINIPNFGGIQISRSDHKKNEVLMQFLIKLMDEDVHEEIKKFFDVENDVELLHGSESFCG